MYASVRRYEGVTDAVAEAGRRVAEGFVPLIRDMDGFVADYCVDAGDGVMCSISVFEDRSGAEASNERAAGMGAGEPGRAGPQPPGDHRRRGGRPKELARLSPRVIPRTGIAGRAARCHPLGVLHCVIHDSRRARYRSSSEGGARRFGATRTPLSRFNVRAGQPPQRRPRRGPRRGRL